VRVPSGEPELVRAAAAGDPAAVAALWDAYGARVFAFCQRLLGRADAAADAAQDAFLLAYSELERLERTGESFGIAVFRAARTTSYELLARDVRAPDHRPGAASSLSAAVARLRPQQRAALALTGLEGLRYGEIAIVLGIGTDAVGALLARARLRVHDELHGTALAAAAVRSPDCEDVLALLAAASDGELGAADAGWADPHVRRCATCPRTRRAMDEAAATYAAWSPAVAPAWLRIATLAELGAEAPAAAAPAAVAGAPDRAARRATTPRASLSAALVGATLLAVALAALLLSSAATLRQGDPTTGANRLPGASRSLRLAAVAPQPAPRPQAGKRAPRHAHRARKARRARRVTFVAVRAVRRATPAPRPTAARRPAGARPRRPASRPKPTPARQPSPSAAPAPPPAAPAPVSADAPADELPGGADDSTMAAVPASAAQAPATATATATPAKTTTSAPSVPAPAAAPAAAPPAVSARGQDRDRGDGWHKAKKPCPPAPRCRHRSCRH